MRTSTHPPPGEDGWQPVKRRSSSSPRSPTPPNPTLDLFPSTILSQAPTPLRIIAYDRHTGQPTTNPDPHHGKVAAKLRTTGYMVIATQPMLQVLPPFNHTPSVDASKGVVLNSRNVAFACLPASSTATQANYEIILKCNVLKGSPKGDALPIFTVLHTAQSRFDKGIWQHATCHEVYTDKGGSTVHTYTMVTKEPRELNSIAEGLPPTQFAVQCGRVKMIAHVSLPKPQYTQAQPPAFQDLAPLPSLELERPVPHIVRRTPTSKSSYAHIVDKPNPLSDGNVPKGSEGPPCLLYTSPSPRDRTRSRMPSSA